jgi:acyl-CoA hydrolase
MTDQGGRFRINRVAETTGIPEATLRAWERRYHVPKPSRTASGYRLYSQDDVAQVRKMRELCEAGISPADAAKEILALDEVKPVLATRQAARVDKPASAAAQPLALGEAQLTEVVSPEHTNTAGVLSLSQAIHLMERAASVAGARAARCPAIVVSCGSVELLVPAGAGQLMEATARVVASREGSMSVDVELAVENLESGERDHVARSTFLLVILESAG